MGFSFPFLFFHLSTMLLYKIFGPENYESTKLLRLGFRSIKLYSGFDEHTPKPLRSVHTVHSLNGK